jgi:enoyl-CoA hydratase
MSGYTAIIYEKHDGVAYIVLNRPEVLNRYNIQMRDELYEVLTAIREDTEVLAVVFKGAGERAFCVGADLTEFGTAPSPIIARQVRWERDVWGLLNDLRQPLIAAVHGYVFGSGMELALFCDMRIACDDAIFGLPEVSLGMIPAAGGTQMLPRVIGKGRALYMLLSGERIGAREAFRMGLVNRVVRREELYSTADKIVQMIVSSNPIAVQYAKEAIRRGCDLKLRDGLSLEGRLAEIVNTSSASMANRVALRN